MDDEYFARLREISSGDKLCRPSGVNMAVEKFIPDDLKLHYYLKSW